MAPVIPNNSFKAVLLDIEGTTTPLSFVTEVLFPFARSHVKDYLLRHGQSHDVRADLEGLWSQYQDDLHAGLEPPSWPSGPAGSGPGSVACYIQWLMDQDRKVTALKSLQGRIWQAGYQSGELRGQVYPDVAPAFEKWAQQQKDICIFSSGSVLAQRLIFRTTGAGDLTRFIRAYFDTTTGAKREEASYRRIAAQLGINPAQIVFVSDVIEELDAASSATMKTVLCVRPNSRPVARTGHPVLETFEQFF